jgi:hypothetical protein
MNITYHISYSSVTPRMFLLGELQPTDRVRVHHTASELERARQHDLAEVYGKLYPCCLQFQVEIRSQQVWSGTGTTKTRIHAGGSRARYSSQYPFNPRMPALTSSPCSDVTSVLLSLLYSTYWATRTSAVGISIPGTLAYAASYILDKAYLVGATRYAATILDLRMIPADVRSHISRIFRPQLGRALPLRARLTRTCH